MNLRLCLHVEISSLRLFSVAMWGLVNRKNFSVVQRLQRFVRFVYGFALAMIFHATVKSLPSSFNFHRCLLSSVSFFLTANEFKARYRNHQMSFRHEKRKTLQPLYH